MGYTQEQDKNQQLNEPDLSGTYTARDYITWQVDGLLELIRGKIFRMSPSPTSWHQIVFSELHFQLKKNFQSTTGCTLWQAPLDVYLVRPGQDYRETRNVVEPDLFIVCNQQKITRRGCIGAPDFVVEILSPSTAKKDATLKLELYQEYGVREYWMVSVAERLIIANLLQDNGEYKIQKPFAEGDVIAPRDFPGLTIELSSLFASLPEDL